MTGMHKVKDIMSKSVLYLLPSDTIFEAAKLFSKFKFSGAPVVNNARDKRIVGIVSETDIMKFLGSSLKACEKIGGEASCTSQTLILLNLLNMGKHSVSAKKDAQKFLRIRIGDVMSADPMHISPEDSVIAAAEKMDRHDINRLPVVTKDGRLVGIIARQDIMRVLLS
jgi:CBS domain-containing protein